MKNNKVSILLITAGAVLFNALFWEEQLGINALLFDTFIISCLFYVYRNAIASTTVRYLLLAHLLCIAAVLIFNSGVSKIAFSATLLLLFAFASYTHRSVWFAAGSLLTGFAGFLDIFFKLLTRDKKHAGRKKPYGSLIRFAIFPLLATICFFIVYCNANSVFATMAGNAIAKVNHFFSSFFELFSFSRLLFLLFGFYLIGALLLRAGYTRFEAMESTAADDMTRTRKKRMDINRSVFYDITVGVMGKLAKGMFALRNEYRTGLVSLVLLNLLLLIINFIDINYLWLHFTYTAAVDLHVMVHEGTEMLILSIVMAMLVVLIFFRGNLNFYRQNKWLKAGAYIWLLQNSLLVFSVLLRDYYYIREWGLAYKRIGVLFFLLLVVAGLVTVFLKVRYAKTSYYLMRVNAWCAVLLLVLGGLVQWDVLIAKYNIEHSKRVPLDLPFLLELSDNTLPVLDANLFVLKEREKDLNQQNISVGRCNNCIEEILSARAAAYVQKQQKYSWLSWNVTDANEKAYFLKKTASVAKEK